MDFAETEELHHIPRITKDESHNRHNPNRLVERPARLEKNYGGNSQGGYIHFELSNISCSYNIFLEYALAFIRTMFHRPDNFDSSIYIT